jgi:hypothetical protein
MEGVAGLITVADAEDAEDPPHPVMIAGVIAAKATPISNSQYRALCSFGAQAKRLLSSVASDRKRVLKCKKDWILDSFVTAATSRLAHIGTALVNTMRVLVPVRENATNFIDTPLLTMWHVQFTSSIIEPQQRKSRLQRLQAKATRSPLLPRPKITSPRLRPPSRS